MRILFAVHDFLPAHPLGTEVYTAQLGRRLVERGHEVHVFCTEKDVSRPNLSVRRREFEGLQVHELINNHFYAKFEETWDYPPAEAAFARCLEELRPDVVHFMHLLYLSAGCVETARATGAPVFFTLHDFWLQCARFGQRIHADGEICHEIIFERCGSCLASFKYAQSGLQRRAAGALARLRSWTGVNLAPAAQRLASRASAAGGPEASPDSGNDPGSDPGIDPDRARELATAAARRDAELRRRVVPAVDRFFAPSRFLEQRFLEWGIPREKLEQLDYGIEAEHLSGLERVPSEELRVAFLGTLAPHKGPDVLVEAWELLAPELRARASLSLFGPRGNHPAWLADLERRAAAVGARLGGLLERAQVPGVLAEVDLLVVPSVWYENQPLIILEGLAAGVPLCVSDLGGMAELVEAQVDGWRFAPGDAGELARILERVLADPTCLRDLPLRPERVKAMRTSAEELENRYARARSERDA